MTFDYAKAPRWLVLNYDLPYIRISAQFLVTCPFSRFRAWSAPRRFSRDYRCSRISSEIWPTRGWTASRWTCNRHPFRLRLLWTERKKKHNFRFYTVRMLRVTHENCRSIGICGQQLAAKQGKSCKWRSEKNQLSTVTVLTWQLILVTASARKYFPSMEMSGRWEIYLFILLVGFYLGKTSNKVVKLRDWNQMFCNCFIRKDIESETVGRSLRNSKLDIWNAKFSPKREFEPVPEVGVNLD